MQTKTSMAAIPQSTKILLSELIDYAGIFPPAALDMPTAVKNYAAYRNSAESWMLGRFIVSAARLKEFETAFAGLSATEKGSATWPLSVVGGANIKEEVAEIAKSNERYSGSKSIPNVKIESFEMKIASESAIRLASRTLIPPELETYFEISPSSAVKEMIEEVKVEKRRAKVRAGGEQPSDVPSVENLAKFLGVCVTQNVAFKATAGLHHPLRSIRKFSGGVNDDFGWMHGFLNLFLAAAFLYHGMKENLVVQILEEHDNAAFQFDANGVDWRGQTISNADLLTARQSFCLSFGSCSFDEPIQDLQALKVL